VAPHQASLRRRPPIVRGVADQLIDAGRTFLEHLAAIGWTALGAALLCHLARLVARAVAWRAIVAAAYPGQRIRLARVFGSYAAGVGVNSIAPARGGDLLKLVLLKHGLPGSTYTTLAPTLLVETLLDSVLGGALLLWALSEGVLPGLDVLPRLPTIDWSWPIDHPRPAIAIGVVWGTVIALLAVVWARKVRDFGQRVRQGFAVLATPRRYLTGVASWQLLSWLFRAASVWAFLDAFGLPATPRNVALVMAVQSISTLLPFTPGGVGTQQGFLVYVFRDATFSTTALVSFSVGMYIATTAFNVILGLVVLLVMTRTVRWKRLVAPAREELEGPSPGARWSD
jgi:uncharacterized membrane protein YbhN (UPF0104 family)